MLYIIGEYKTYLIFIVVLAQYLFLFCQREIRFNFCSLLVGIFLSPPFMLVWLILTSEGICAMHSIDVQYSFGKGKAHIHLDCQDACKMSSHLICKMIQEDEEHKMELPTWHSQIFLCRISMISLLSSSTFLCFTLPNIFLFHLQLRYLKRLNIFKKGKMGFKDDHSSSQRIL